MEPRPFWAASRDAHTNVRRRCSEEEAGRLGALPLDARVVERTRTPAGSNAYATPPGSVTSAPRDGPPRPRFRPWRHPDDAEDSGGQ